MKTYKIFGLIAAMVLTFASCETDVDDPAGPRGVAPVPSISNISPSFYDLLTLDESIVQFTVSVAPEDGVDAILIQASFNGNKQRVEVARETTNEAVFTISAAEAANNLGIGFADISLGDIFNFEVVLFVGGKYYRSNSAINANVACASDIAGIYNLVASGAGGGGLDGLSPWTSTIATAEIVSVDGGVTYTITPALGGIMVDYYSGYGAEIVTGQIQDICGEITNAVVHDGWNAVKNYSGSIDEETGVITIDFEISWGDNAQMILTPVGK